MADLSPQADQDLFYTTEGQKIIRRQLKEIVATEGPIERGLVDQRIIEAWGFSRGGTKIRQTIADVLTQTVQTETEGTDVLWPKELDRENYTAVRIPNPAIPKSVRDIDQIPGIERRNAMLQLLQDYGSMPEDTLLRETLKLFGKRTLTGKIRTTLMSSLEALGDQVVRENGTVKLA